MTDKSFDQLLHDKIEQLPQEKQPSRDLWQGIDIALTEVSSQGMLQAPTQVAVQTKSGAIKFVEVLRDWVSIKPMALAASVMLMAFVSWNSSHQLTPPSSSTQLVMQMMKQHEEQKSVLLASFADAPELTSNWQAQLQELEDAASAIESVLQSDPENITLLKMLQHVHQQQLELIETVHKPSWQTI